MMETGRKRGIGFFQLFVIFLAVLGYLLRQGQGLVPSTAELYMGSLIYLICCLPIFVYFNRKELNIPCFPAYCFIYFTYYGAGVFINQKLFQLTPFPIETIEKTLRLCLAGIISLIVAFYSSRKPMETLLPRLSINMDLRKSYGLALKIFFGSLFITMVIFKGETGVQMSGVKNFIVTLPLLSIVMLFTMFINGQLNRKGKIWLWLVFVPIRFLFLLSLGGFGPLVYEASALFYVYFYIRQRMPILGTIVVAVVFFFIWGARDSFRELTWHGGRFANLGAYSKSLVYVRLVYDRMLQNKADFEYDSPGERLSLRTNQLITFVHTVNATPTYVPYWNGYTYNSFFYALIPRFIFPDKPKKTLGSEFGHRYQLLDSSDGTTSYNLPILVELYINFGEVGVVLGMFLMGLIIRAFYCLVNHPKCGDGGLTIGALLFATIINMDSDFSLVFGNLLQYMLLFYFIIRHVNIPKDGAKEAQAVLPG
jgi:hypothetical protein